MDQEVRVFLDTCASKVSTMNLPWRYEKEGLVE